MSSFRRLHGVEDDGVGTRWDDVVNGRDSTLGLIPRIVARINVCASKAVTAQLMRALWWMTRIPWKLVIALVYFVSIFYAYLRMYPIGPESHFKQMRYDYNDINRLTIAAASLIGDCFVVAVHLVFPPHPKFCLRRVRKFFIALHVISGINEITFGILAFISGRPQVAVYIMWICDVGHMVSAISQVPLLFGIKEIMVPAYAYCILTKTVCAAGMLMHPTSIDWLFATFLMHHVYVWVRIYYKILSWMGTMSDHLYTFAIILAGMTCGPAAVGSLHTLVLFAVVLIFIKMLPLCYPNMQNDLAQLSFWKGENARNVYMNEGFKATLAVAAEKEKNDWYMQSPEVQAKMVFDFLDRDGSGLLSMDELDKVFEVWFHQSSTNTLNSQGIQTIEKIKKRVEERGGIDFATFQRYVMKCGIYPFSQGIVADKTTGMHKVHPLLQVAGRTCREKAMLWFESYASVQQADGVKALNLADLTQLFYQYGYPGLYLLVPIIWQITDANHDGVVTFEEFFDLRHTALITPVWKFMEEHHMARVVFETLDADKSNSVDVDELAEVLMESGMPKYEADRTLALFDTNKSGRIDFDEFFKYFRPLYIHTFENIQQAVQLSKQAEEAKASRKAGIMSKDL